MASITERAQRMEKDLRETTAKHDRAAAELQVSLEDLRACGARVRFARGGTCLGGEERFAFATACYDCSCSVAVVQIFKVLFLIILFYFILLFLRWRTHS